MEFDEVKMKLQKDKWKSEKAESKENIRPDLTLEDALETIEYMEKRIKELSREQKKLLFKIANLTRVNDNLRRLLNEARKNRRYEPKKGEAGFSDKRDDWVCRCGKTRREYLKEMRRMG